LVTIALRPDAARADKLKLSSLATSPTPKWVSAAG
jgi:hypothetical protein